MSPGFTPAVKWLAFTARSRVSKQIRSNACSALPGVTPRESPTSAIVGESPLPTNDSQTRGKVDGHRCLQWGIADGVADGVDGLWTGLRTGLRGRVVADEVVDGVADGVEHGIADGHELGIGSTTLLVLLLLLLALD